MRSSSSFCFWFLFLFTSLVGIDFSWVEFSEEAGIFGLDDFFPSRKDFLGVGIFFGQTKDLEEIVQKFGRAMFGKSCATMGSEDGIQAFNDAFGRSFFQNENLDCLCARWLVELRRILRLS